MLKDSRTRYTFQGDIMTLKELFNWVRKRPGRAKILASVMVTIGEDDKGNPVAAKIVFVRDRSKKSFRQAKFNSLPFLHPPYGKRFATLLKFMLG